MTSKATWSKAKVQRGSFAENMALDLLGGRGWKADEHNDIYHHIDIFYLHRDGEIFGADIKSIKLQNDHQFFVEIKNSFGMAGWLYGKATEIWFERFDSFLIHDLEVLRCMVEHKIKTINQTPTKQPCAWRFYRREIRHDFGTRFDKSIIVPLQDLLLFGEELPKSEAQIRQTLEFYNKQKGVL